jgi:hypothetical protein
MASHLYLKTIFNCVFAKKENLQTIFDYVLKNLWKNHGGAFPYFGEKKSKFG